MAWVAEEQDLPAAPAQTGYTEEKPKTWGDTASSVLQTVDDAVRAAANAVTFGMADRLSGQLNRATGLTNAPDYGTAVDEEVRRSDNARVRSPVASVVGDVAGSVALPALGGGALAARLGGGGVARAVGYGAEGLAVGAAQGAGGTYTEKLPDYLKNMAVGGGMGAVLGGALGSAFAPRGRVSAAEVPTWQQNRASADARYGSLDRNQALYDPAALRQVGTTLENAAIRRSNPVESPGTWRAFDQMQDGFPQVVRTPGVPGHTLQHQTPQNITPAHVEEIRQGLNAIPRGEARAADRATSREARQALSDFLENPPPGAVRPGTEAAAAEAGRTATAARGDWAASQRGEDLWKLRESATNATAAQHSGLNFENVLRQKYRSYIDPNTGAAQKNLAGHTAEERQALTDLVRRGRIANAVRWTGNTMAGGGGAGVPVVGGVLATAAGGGAYATDRDPITAGAMGALVPAAGLLIRRGGNAAMARQTEAVERLINSRSPLYLERAAQAGTVPGPSALSSRNVDRTRNAITGAITKQQQAPEVDEYGRIIVHAGSRR